MLKILKWTIGTFIALLVFGVVAVLLLPIIITPEDYKPQIVQMVKDRTGRDLVIDGPVALSVFPNVGLTLGKAQLSNAPGFGDGPFARVDAVNIQVALLPLLGEKIEMDEVVLQGLSLDLQRRKDGRSNWDDLAGPDKKSHVETGQADTAGKSRGVKIESLKVAGMRIEGATIRWRDDVKGKQYAIRDFNLASGALTADNPVSIEMRSRFDSRQPAMNGQVALTAVIETNSAGDQFSVRELDMQLDVADKRLPGGSVDVALTATLASLDIPSRQLALDGVSLQMPGLMLLSASKAQGVMGVAPQFTGNINIMPFNVRALLQSLGQQVPVTADPEVLATLRAGFDLTVTKAGVSLNNLEAMLDDTRINGRLAVEDFASRAVSFDLALDRIDLDRYLPPASSDPERSAGTGEGDVSLSSGDREAVIFPVEALRALHAKGVARIGALEKKHLRMTDVVLDIRAVGGKLDFKSSAKLYEGLYKADTGLDVRGAQPAINVNATLAGVQVAPLLEDLQGKARLAGNAHADIKVSAIGNTQSALKGTLNGTADFNFAQGALVGVNIARIIREGYAMAKGQPVAKVSEPEKTDFSVLKGSATIKNGVIDNQDFSMKSPLLRINGAGSADLVQEQLDYLLKASIAGTLPGKDGEDIARLKGLTIPVRVTGPFARPSYKPDLSAVASDVVKKKVKEKIRKKIDKKKEEISDKLKDKLEDKLKDKLKGLF